MSDRLTPAQIRGARAMLDWSMMDLSKAARVSVSTIKRAENAGPLEISEATHASIQGALETEGMQFLPDDGDGLGIRFKTR